MIKIKAGIIPYYIENKIIHCMFMVPSDPDYGGTQPQIAKGRVDNLPQDIDAITPNLIQLIKNEAIREGHEELGLKLSNIEKTYLAGSLQQGRETRVHLMYVFAARIRDQNDFMPHGWETGKVVWMPSNQLGNFRQDQRILLYECLRSIKKAENL